MTPDFSRALARAMERVRAQDPLEATAIIQAALGQAAPTQAASGQASGQAGQQPPTSEPAAPEQVRHSRRAPDVQEAEVVEAAPQKEAPGGMAGDTARGTARDTPRAGERRSLREVVDLLRGGRAALDLPAFDLPAFDLPGLDLGGIDLPGLDLPGARPPAPPLPEGARFEWRTHACAAGTRRYRLFLPSCAASELQGLVLMLHGCTQGPDDFAAGTGMNRLAEDARLVVAYPEQPRGANTSGCWNWFEPGHQRRDAGEPAILADLARGLAAEFALPPGRIFAAGLSAGGAMAAVLAETHGDIFAAVGIHSGLPHGAAHDVASAFAAMRGLGGAAAPGGRRPAARGIVFHGTADHTVSPGNAHALAARYGIAGDMPGSAPETGTTAGRSWRRNRDADQFELWLVEGAGHAWSGGHPSGSFTDPKGPDASAEMLRFFLAGA